MIALQPTNVRWLCSSTVLKRRCTLLTCARVQLTGMDSTHLIPDALLNSPYKHELEVAVQAAKDAGRVIAAAFRQPKNITEKANAADLVTETDQQAEKLILGRIRAAFPDHHFIGEEQSAAQGFASGLTDEPTWMCDPLDGTTNFVHSFPWVCTSLALTVKQQVVVGVVYNPIMDELFLATQGNGAFLNGQPIRASPESELGKALIITEVGTARDADTFDAIFDRMRALTARVRGLRCCGSCALNMCSVACGRAEAFYEIGFGGCWDCAAAALVVSEAGGRVLDPAGGPFGLMSRRVLATNAQLGDAVSGILAECKLGSSEPAPLDAKL